MKHISSRDNPLYKRVARLADGKRVADERGRPGYPVLLEGVHLCQEWLRLHGNPDMALFDAQRLTQNPELLSLADAVSPAFAVTCETQLIKALSQVGHGQGVYFMVLAPVPLMPERIDHNCLWLDRVQDPGNVGTLLRTAAAAGIAHAYLSPGCASAWSAKVVRSAQGAHFSMAIHENVDLHKARELLAVPLLATALDDAGSLFETVLPPHCAWLFGNEGQGADPALLAAADSRVFIPQSTYVESLNVAVAAGICLFEQRRVHATQA
ncbi:MAG TPA: RNA methyltransferase [Candidimonas sp.]|nr:RNA methyltransferase [Candidimonas sp.]